MNTYDIGDLVRLSAAFAVGGAATDPTSLTFKLKTPSGAVTTYVYGVDAELVKDSTGNYHVDYAPADDGVYWYRFAGAGGATDAEELSFEVRPSELEDGTPVTPPTTTMLNVPAGGSVGDVLVWDGLAWAAVAGKHVTADQRAAADAANGPDAGNALATMDDIQTARATVIDNAGDVTGNYATVGEALAAITDAASTKRYVIALRGKTTETADVTWKRYVNLVGDSEGHAEIAGAYSILLATGSDGDQRIENVAISMALGTSEASARMELVGCRLTGGVTLAHNGANIMVRESVWSGALDTGAATSGTIEFRNCSVSVTTTWNVKTQTYRHCVFAVNVALGSISSVTFHNSSVAISTVGGIALASGTLALYGCTGNPQKIAQSGGTLNIYNSILSGSAGSDNMIELDGAVTFLAYCSSISNLGAASRAVYISNGSADPTLFRMIGCHVYGVDVGIDSDQAYAADLYLSAISGTPLALTAKAGTALGTNVLF